MTKDGDMESRSAFVRDRLKLPASWKCKGPIRGMIPQAHKDKSRNVRRFSNPELKTAGVIFMLHHSLRREALCNCFLRLLDLCQRSHWQF
jgi:hypothetical protein